MSNSTTLEFTDGVAYERFMGRWSRTVGSAFLEWLAPPAHARWLEVGCGTGVFTDVLLKAGSPDEVIAVDPSRSQIEYAIRQTGTRQVQFQIADAQALPFADASFDIVVSALVINFIADRTRGLAEMRRVARPGGIIAGYVWDFTSYRSPSWPLRLGLRRFGVDTPDVPGTDDSSLAALELLFERNGLQAVATRAIESSLTYPDFADFWDAQTPSYSPMTRSITSMTRDDRKRLIRIVKEETPTRPDGVIEYSARAHAIRARRPIA